MIRTENLSVQYGGVTALREVTLTMERGRITAVVGPSGCGKSSFLAAINRLTDLIPSARVSGQILLAGHDIRNSTLSPMTLRRRVGMIFQNPNPFAMSIRRNIQLALREHGEHRKERLNEVTETVLRDVGLFEEVKDRLDRPAMSLSGGQQQRLCMARALALEPDVLLMDEPCSALDPIAAGAVEDLILRLRDRFTMVIVTHNLPQARRIADHVAVFWMREGAGVLIESGPGSRLFAAPKDATVAAYLAGVRG